MEEISAFAAYGLNKSKTKKPKEKKVKSPKSQPNKKNEKPAKTAQSDTNAAKEALIQQILQAQFSKKPNKSKKKNKFDEINDKSGFSSPIIKKQKFSTSTPNEENRLPKKKVKLATEHTIVEENNFLHTNGKETDKSECSSSVSSTAEGDNAGKNANKKATKILKNETNQSVNTKLTAAINNTMHSPKSILKTPTQTSKSSAILKSDSVEDGKKVFKWLIDPIETQIFFEKFWEKQPCLVQRIKSDYYSQLLSFAMIDRMLIENHVEFTKNIDITKYENGVRETLNPEGRALPGAVWDKYAEGCSIRLLNPQTFLPTIFALNTTLQEYFHCMVGANVYLTPPNSQGFAPHYDDIEAFVIQIEGKKQWKLYNPRSQNEELPRFSSPNFNQDEIGEPILEKTLEPGNILYFPRGTIHQANTVPGCHSLHITLSVYQRQSYADLCEKLFPLILKRAIQNDLEMRRGLPLHIWSNMGVVHAETESDEREEVFNHVSDCIRRAISEIPLDEAVDQLAKKFQHEALPPDIKFVEKPRTVFGCKNFLNEEGEVVSNFEMLLEHRVRLLRANILRLVQEEDTLCIYFYVDNSKEFQEYEPNFIEIEAEQASAIDVLVKCYPDYVCVKDLPLDDEEKKLTLAQALWDRGLIMLREAAC